MLVPDQNGRPWPRPVLIGLTTRVTAEIVAGLDAGEAVVVASAAAPAARGPAGLLGGLGRR